MTTSARWFSPSDRIWKMRDRLLSTPFEIDIERPRWYTRVWREMEKAAPCIRTARALEETLRHITIRIEDEDHIVGIKTTKTQSPISGVERNPLWGSTRVQSSGMRKLFAETSLKAEEISEFYEEILPFWKSRSCSVRKKQLMTEAGMFDVEKNAFISDNMGLVALDTQGHVIPGYHRVLKLGFHGISEWAHKRLKEIDHTDIEYEHKMDFLESLKVTSRAVCDYSERFALLAEEMSIRMEGKRKMELLDIAGRCRRVPSGPAQTFMDALQSLWMTHCVLVISYGIGDVFSTGRIDQYLYPYYKKDLEAGRITPEQAADAINEYHIKISTAFLPAQYTFTIGGVDGNGRDATNVLSYMFLHSLEKLGAVRNNYSVRVSPATPDSFIVKAWETHRKGGGVAFYNDEIVIRDLLADGYSLEDARDYSIVGCVEPTTTGKEFSYTAGNWISLVKALELAMNGGAPLSDSSWKIGASTPHPTQLNTFEEVLKAFEDQVIYSVDKCVELIEIKDRAYAENFPSPLLSSTIEGCLESGKDVTRGGARYNNGHIGTQGIATVTNSLAAIRRAVFERKMLTMEELVGHLRHNFKDAENLRYELMRKAPKYGNDDPSVDELARWLVDLFCREVRKQKCGRGGMYRPLILSTGFQIQSGYICGAMPDGRLSGEPLTDGCSPAHGTEQNGLTAVLKSAAYATNGLVSDGSTLTLNLSPALLKNVESINKLVSLLKGYFKLGGRHVQFTPVSVVTLKDAQKNPDRYHDLTVKVSGYSALFVDLPEPLQNDIIARTEFAEV